MDMARGNSATHAVNRDLEHTTDVLLGRLADSCSETERQALTTELVELNLGLCDALARRYLHRGADLDDLVQVARAALLLAIRRYRHGAGQSFYAFATPTITGELKRHFRDHCWAVRPPRSVQELQAHAHRVAGRLEQSLGRAVTSDDLANELSLDPVAVRAALAPDGSYWPFSLDAPLGASNATLGGALADPEDAFARAEDKLCVRRLLARLHPRDRKVLWWRFGEDLSQRDIADRLGVSQMQVSRMMRRILEQARGALEGEEAVSA
jgi:RNA polymerase sigma-B factor